MLGKYSFIATLVASFVGFAVLALNTLFVTIIEIGSTGYYRLFNWMLLITFVLAILTTRKIKSDRGRSLIVNGIAFIAMSLCWSMAVNILPDIHG